MRFPIVSHISCTALATRYNNTTALAVFVSRRVYFVVIAAYYFYARRLDGEPAQNDARRLETTARSANNNHIVGLIPRRRRQSKLSAVTFEGSPRPVYILQVFLIFFFFFWSVRWAHFLPVLSMHAVAALIASDMHPAKSISFKH